MVQEWKLKQVEELSALMKKAQVVGIIDMFKLPAAQLQNIKRDLRGKALIRMAKKNVIYHALEKVGKKNLEQITKSEAISPALIISEENPFRLFQLLEKSKVDSFIKAGEIANKMITVPKGDTGLPPGPIIGELQKVGIKAKIMGGGIDVLEDSVVAKPGDKISKELAAVLTRVGIKPVKIGLNLVCLHEGETIFGRDVLNINIPEYEANMRKAARDAFLLAIEVEYVNSETIMVLVQRAHDNALLMALEAGIANKETAEKLVAKACAQAQVLASRMPEVPAQAEAQPPQPSA